MTMKPLTNDEIDRAESIAADRHGMRQVIEASTILRTLAELRELRSARAASAEGGSKWGHTTREHLCEMFHEPKRHEMLMEVIPRRIVAGELRTVTISIDDFMAMVAMIEAATERTKNEPSPPPAPRFTREQAEHQQKLASGERGPIKGVGLEAPVGYYIRATDIVDSAHSGSHGWIVLSMASQAWWENPNDLKGRLLAAESENERMRVVKDESVAAGIQLGKENAALEAQLEAAIRREDSIRELTEPLTLERASVVGMVRQVTTKLTASLAAHRADKGRIDQYAVGRVDQLEAKLSALMGRNAKLVTDMTRLHVQYHGQTCPCLARIEAEKESST